MVDADTILSLGSSVKRGLLSMLLDMPAPDYERIFGIPLALTVAGEYPATSTIQGVRLWTPRMPYATFSTRSVVSSTNSTLTYGSTTVSAPADSWVFISDGTSGQGSFRQVVTDASNIVTIDGTWSANPTSDGEIIFFTKSYSVDAVVVSTGTTITRSVGSDWVANEFAGKFVIFPSGAAGQNIRRIASNTTTVLTLDDAVVAFDDTPFIILTGTGASETLDGMATGAVLQDLTLHLNNSPVALTGYDYCNWNLQPAVAAPIISAATINCDPEMYWQFRTRFGGTVYGLDISRDSAALAPYKIGTALRTLTHSWQHDITQLDFHPSSEDGLWQAFATAVASLQGLIEDEGNTMRVRCFVALIADNDAIVQYGGAQRHLRVGANMALLFAAVRELVGDPDLPCVAVGPTSPDYPLAGADSSAYPYSEAIYQQLEQLVMEDTNAEFVDQRDRDVFILDDDNLHLVAEGQTNLGIAIPLAYDRIVAGNTTTAVDICNLALSHIGESAKVTSLDTTIDTSAQARHCARFYPQARDHLIEQHSWDFATRRTELVAVPATQYARTEWTYAYEAPREMAGAIAILAPGSAHDAPSQLFEKEADPSGRTIIYTDVPDAVIRYNRRVTNTRKFSASFGRALSWQLAADLAGPITKDMKKVEGCIAMLGKYLPLAKTHDSNQKKSEHAVEAPWMPGGEMPYLPRRWDPWGHA